MESTSSALVKSRPNSGAVLKMQKNLRTIVGKAGTIIKQARNGEFRFMITPHIILYLRHHHYHHHHHHHHHYHHFRKPQDEQQETDVPDDTNEPNQLAQHEYQGEEPSYSNCIFNQPHYENIFDMINDRDNTCEGDFFNDRNCLTSETLRNCNPEKCKIVHSTKTKNIVKRLYTLPVRKRARRTYNLSSSNDIIKRNY